MGRPRKTPDAVRFCSACGGLAGHTRWTDAQGERLRCMACHRRRNSARYHAMKAQRAERAAVAAYWWGGA